MYEIEFSIKAAKSYLKLQEKLRNKIDKKLEKIAQAPFAKYNNIKSLKGIKGCYRLRIGDWRIIYEIIKGRMKIYIIKIGQRKEVYK